MTEPSKVDRLRETHRLRDDSEALASALPPLLVEAEAIAMALAPGVHGRRRSGPGERFWQYRRYADTDPASTIDWRQSARTDHLFVRENEWEAAHDVLMWCDMSASMDYAGDAAPCTKARRAAVLVLALASLLVRGGERVGPLDGATRPDGGRGAVRRLAARLSGYDTPTGERPAGEVMPMARSLKRSTRIVLASDFLMDPDTLDIRLRSFGAAGARGHLVHICDPSEADLPFSGRTRFEDMEDGATMVVGRVESIRAEYKSRFADHRARLIASARRWGWTYTLHRTDDTPATPLLALYDAIAGGTNLRAGSR